MCVTHMRLTGSTGKNRAFACVGEWEPYTACYSDIVIKAPFYLNIFPLKYDQMHTTYIVRYIKYITSA